MEPDKVVCVGELGAHNHNLVAPRVGNAHLAKLRQQWTLATYCKRGQATALSVALLSYVHPTILHNPVDQVRGHLIGQVLQEDLGLHL